MIYEMKKKKRKRKKNGKKGKRRIRNKNTVFFKSQQVIDMKAQSPCDLSGQKCLMITKHRNIYYSHAHA